MNKLKAEIINKNLSGFRGEAWLFKMPEKIPLETIDEMDRYLHSKVDSKLGAYNRRPQPLCFYKNDISKTEYFIASGTPYASDGWEISIFPATENGKVLFLIPQPGSGSGDIIHEKAIRDFEKWATKVIEERRINNE